MRAHTPDRGSLIAAHCSANVPHCCSCHEHFILGCRKKLVAHMEDMQCRNGRHTGSTRWDEWLMRTQHNDGMLYMLATAGRRRRA